MQGCLGILCLLLIISALVASVTYNLVVNDNLHFETRDSRPEHVNTRRTYRTLSPTYEGNDFKNLDSEQKSR